MDTDYENLLSRLAAAKCPYKLYPARLRALEVVTGESLLTEVQTVVAMRIGVTVGGIPMKRQFERDLETYGLFEAILYFSSYPSLPEDFVEDACGLYERLAALYLAQHERISTSDDPRVLVQLEVLRRFGDSSEHTLPQPRRRCRVAPEGIAAGRRPSPEPAYERCLIVHPDLLYLGKVDEVETLADELVEQLGATFTFDGFPGIQAMFFDAADALDEFEISPFGAEGQYVLGQLVEYVGMEMFGDFERWVPCVECEEEFMVEVTLDRVNDTLLNGGWRCDRCMGERSE